MRHEGWFGADAEFRLVINFWGCAGVEEAVQQLNFLGAASRSIRHSFLMGEAFGSAAACCRFEENVKKKEHIGLFLKAAANSHPSPKAPYGRENYAALAETAAFPGLVSPSHGSRWVAVDGEYSRVAQQYYD